MKIHQDVRFSRVRGLVQEFCDVEDVITKKHGLTLYKYIKLFLLTLFFVFLCALFMLDNLSTIPQFCVIVLVLIIVSILFLFHEFPDAKIPVSISSYVASVILIVEIENEIVKEKKSIQKILQGKNDVLDDMSSYGEWKEIEFEARKIMKTEIREKP